MSFLQNNVPEYSVSEFNFAIKETVSSAFDLIKIRGEISNLKNHSSGHIYFSLKDEDSVINAVCWRTNVKRLNFNPEDGVEVIVIGKVTTYAKSISVYQINVENIKIAGEGALLKLVEDRKKKLEKKGFFDDSKKKPLPLIPKSIGLITSPTGSVLKDIIHRIKERFPLPIQLWPAPVQGKECSKLISEAIKGFNDVSFKDKPDIIIIARGGGSIEDLMPFNDENLIESIFKSKIPIISAIGHETDNPIIDYVSDLRSPTPSAAAEKCVPVRKDLIMSLSLLCHNMDNAVDQNYFQKRDNYNQFYRLLQDPSRVIKIFYSELSKLIYQKDHQIENLVLEKNNALIKLQSRIKNPNEKLKHYKILLSSLVDKINLLFLNETKNKRNKVNNLSQVLTLSSVEQNLKKGYAIVKKGKKIVTNSNSIKLDDLIDIKFRDNNILAKVKKI